MYCKNHRCWNLMIQCCGLFFLSNQEYYIQQLFMLIAWWNRGSLNVDTRFNLLQIFFLDTLMDVVLTQNGTQERINVLVNFDISFYTLKKNIMLKNYFMLISTCISKCKLYLLISPSVFFSLSPTQTTLCWWLIDQPIIVYMNAHQKCIEKGLKEGRINMF